MNRVRLLPVVVLAIAALLVFKTIGLVTNGGYVLGVTSAQASGGGSAAPAGGEGGSATLEQDLTVTPAVEPTMQDTSPVMVDPSPTMADQAAAGESTVAADHGVAPAEPAAAGHGEAPAGDGGAAPEGEAAAPAPAADQAAAAGPTSCFEANVTLNADGSPPPEAAKGEAAPSAEEVAAAADKASGDAAAFAKTVSTDCLPTGDAVPMQLNADGSTTPLINSDGTSATEKQILERLAARRTELEKYEQDLTLRASIVDAAEKKIEERTATLQALETQISTLVDQRKEMESGQFAGIIAMYEAMKPADAATIFNTLDMDVLLRVAKTMNPRKMSPILAAMDPARAQELTVKMANLADAPTDQMTPQDLSALPQIVGQ